jgi:hypothetical protein
MNTAEGPRLAGRQDRPGERAGPARQMVADVPGRYLPAAVMAYPPSMPGDHVHLPRRAR